MARLALTLVAALACARGMDMNMGMGAPTHAGTAPCSRAPATELEDIRTHAARPVCVPGACAATVVGFYFSD